MIRDSGRKLADNRRVRIPQKILFLADLIKRHTIDYPGVALGAGSGGYQHEVLGVGRWIVKGVLAAGKGRRTGQKYCRQTANSHSSMLP